MTTKSCNSCKAVKELDEFSKNHLGRYGRRSNCKECYNAMQNKPEALARVKKMRRNCLTWRANAAFGSLKKSASTRNLELSITARWIEEQYRRGVCSVTGIPFVFNYEDDKHTVITRSNREMNPFSPSIERKDSEKGYTEDNCVVVVFMFNLAKNSFSEEALEMFCRAYLNKLDN